MKQGQQCLPANPDLANILGTTGFDFDNFHVSIFFNAIPRHLKFIAKSTQDSATSHKILANASQREAGVEQHSSGQYTIN